MIQPQGTQPSEPLAGSTQLLQGQEGCQTHQPNKVDQQAQRSLQSLESQFLRTMNPKYDHIVSYYDHIIQRLQRAKKEKLTEHPLNNISQLNTQQQCLLQEIKQGGVKETERERLISYLRDHGHRNKGDQQYVMSEQQYLSISDVIKTANTAFEQGRFTSDNQNFGLDVPELVRSIIEGCLPKSMILNGDTPTTILPPHIQYSEITSMSFHTASTKLIRILRMHFPKLQKLGINTIVQGQGFGKLGDHNQSKQARFTSELSKLDLKQMEIGNWTLPVARLFECFASMKNLKTLKLSETLCQPRNIIELCLRKKNLQNIKFNTVSGGGTIMAAEPLNFLVKTNPDLRSISFQCITFNETAVKAFSQLSHLTEIKVITLPPQEYLINDAYAPQNQGGFGMHGGFGYQNAFQRNSMSICRAPEGFQTIITNCPHLKSLSFTTFPVSENDIAYLYQKLPGLEELFIQTSFTSVIGYETLGQFKSLKRLYIKTATSGQNLLALGRMKSNLSVLYFRNTFAIVVANPQNVRPNLMNGRQNAFVAPTNRPFSTNEPLINPLQIHKIFENQKELQELKLGNPVNNKIAMAISLLSNLQILQIKLVINGRALNQRGNRNFETPTVFQITDAGFYYLSKLRGLKKFSTIGFNIFICSHSNSYFKVMRNNKQVQVNQDDIVPLQPKMLRNLFIMKKVPRLQKVNFRETGRFGTQVFHRNPEAPNLFVGQRNLPQQEDDEQIEQ